MYQYKATIDRVIDGDTAVLDVDLGFYTSMKLHFRFFGINAPEKTDKVGWVAATDYTKKFFEENPTVIVNVYGQDKYGRWLGDFLDPNSNTSLNTQLVDNGLAKVYLP
jgi:endonuclease YncB( thermonuclease family)